VTLRFAVTGANGFVGRQLVRHAVGRGFEAVGIVRSAVAARMVSADGGHPALVSGLSAEALAPVFAGCRAVVHLAQIGGERGGATYDAVNVSGTQAVIDAARAAGVPRVVYFSGLGVAHYGLARRCTNRYFLSKLSAEILLFRSDRETVVFRPSYILGPGGGLVPSLLTEMAGGEVEMPGDGAYRMQPIAARDVAALVLAAVEREPAGLMHGDGPGPRVYDLVGPEPVSYRAFLERLVRATRAEGRPLELRLRQIPLAEVDRQAAAGGYRGLLPDEVDCLFCDEVSDSRPLEALAGRPLTPLDEALGWAVRAVAQDHK
jgi:nucleoside-diphosphate-sugar epimerase